MLRERARADWQGGMLTTFEEVFDEAATGEEVLRIPRIELRVRLNPQEATTISWPSAIREQVLAQLREWVGSYRTAATNQLEPQRDAVQSFGSSGELLGASSVSYEWLHTLLHYLSTGSIDWGVSHIGADELVTELREISQERRSEVLSYLKSRPNTSVAMWFRWLQLLPPDQAEEMLRWILREDPTIQQARLFANVALRLLRQSDPSSRFARLYAAAFLLSEAVAGHSCPSAIDVLRIVREVAPDDDIRNALILATAETGIAVLAPPPRSQLAFADDTSGQDYDELETGAEEPSPVRRYPEKLPAARRAFSLARSRQQPPVFPATTRPAGREEFPLKITHAGLILLHPFLPHFFAVAGISAGDNEAISSTAIPRAAALLHYLATGQEEIHEFDLVFIKVLLALQPDTPLCVAEGLVSEMDKLEAEALLQSVIEHWSVLKQTSIAGLRNSFLRRSGLLRASEDGWIMQVEREPFDVLIEHLPWAISIVKLPWMKGPIYTEW